MTPLTVTEIAMLVQNLYDGTRPILNKLDPSSMKDVTFRRESYAQLFDLYREYMLLENEVNLPHLDQSQTKAYVRLGVRFRENLAELRP